MKKEKAADSMNLDTLRPRILKRSFWVALLLILSLLALQQGLRAASLDRTLAAHYEQSFSTLSETLSALEQAVNLSAVAATPDQAVAAASAALSASGAAKTALDLLPLTGHNLDTLNRYLCQAGDYTLARAQKAVLGEGYTGAEREEIAALAQYTGELSAAVSQLSANYSGKEMRFTEPTVTLAQASAEVPLPTMQQELSDCLSSLTGYGELIYDGVYSDREEGLSPLLASLEPLSEEEALKRAGEFLSCSPESLQSLGRSEGALPTYTFTDGVRTLELTERGGLPLLFFGAEDTSSDGTAVPVSGDSEHTAPRGTLPYALESAKQFLSAHGISDLTLCYYQCTGDQLYAVFACEEDGVLCYPDRVTLGLSISTGQVLSLSAEEYLTHHSEKRALQSSLSAEEALRVLPEGWSLLSTRLCVIPTAGEKERLCYEALCTDGEQRALYYYSADTGACIASKLLYESAGGVIAH